MKEIYKDIPTYEGMYKASSLGNIKSLSRVVTNKRGFYNLKEKILKPHKRPDGYLHVSLNEGCFLVHILVAMTFINHKPNGRKIMVDHIDENKSNNKADNLQLLTNRQNVAKSNLLRNTSSKHTGVCWDKSRNKWVAQIKINGKRKYLGRFTNELEAGKAYQTALKNIDI